MYRTQNITLDVRAIYADIYLDATQFDTARVFLITLVDNGIEVSTTGKSVTFAVTLPDGVQIDTNVTNVNNGIYVEFADPFTLEAGKFKYQLQVGTDTILGTIIINKFLADYSLLEDFVDEAEEAATMAKSYNSGDTGVRPDEDTDNAKYYYDLIKTDTFGLCYVADIGFAQLSDVPHRKNYMYKVLNEFTSNSNFIDGGGVRYPAGCYVFYTDNNKLQCFSGENVVGVKGDGEDYFRKGNIVLYKVDFGLQNGVNVSFSSSTPTNDDYWFRPNGSSTSTYDPYKIYAYKAADNTYKLMSFWAKTDTIERANGRTIETYMNTLERYANEFIDDNDISEYSAWSSEKIGDYILTLPQLDDNSESLNTVWSSEKQRRYIQRRRLISTNSTVNLDMFEGLFAIVEQGVGGGVGWGVIGIVDRWHGITYLAKDIYSEKNPGGIATITVNGDIISITNYASHQLVVYYFTTWAFA